MNPCRPILKRLLASLTLASFFLNPLVAYAQLLPAPGVEEVSIPTLLNPTDYGITEPAQELPGERTLRTATFDLGGGKRAQVSVPSSLFTHHPELKDQIIFAHEKGVQKGTSFAFDYLPQDTRVSFDLTKPSYTLSKGDHSFTLSFATNSSIQGTVLNDHQVSYPLSENATLVWTVEGMNVRKEIKVRNTGIRQDFTFNVTSDLDQKLVNDSIVLRSNDEVIFQTEKPFLLTTSGEALLNPIALIKNEDGSYGYEYDEEGLPEEYVVDPSADSNASPPSIQDNSSNGGTIPWDNQQNQIAVNPGDVSHYITWSNMNFNLPSGVSITGIEVSKTGHPGTGEPVDHDVRIIKSDGTISSTNLSTGAAWPAGYTTVTYGGNNVLWGESWMYDDINDPDFGFAYAAAFTHSADAYDIYYSVVTMRVYYTLPNGSACSSDSDCTTSLCFNGFCQPGCACSSTTFSLPVEIGRAHV